MKCIKCESKFRIESSKRAKTADVHQRWVVNVAAVPGQMSTGGGTTSFTCTMAPMNVPGMPKRLYAATERFVSDSMKQILTENYLQQVRRNRNWLYREVISTRAFQSSP